MITYTHDSELQAITAVSLFSTFYKSLHPISSQFVFTSRYVVTNLNSGDFSASMVTPLPAG
jgi:hypothetical protein